MICSPPFSSFSPPFCLLNKPYIYSVFSSGKHSLFTAVAFIVSPKKILLGKAFFHFQQYLQQYIYCVPKKIFLASTCCFILMQRLLSVPGSINSGLSPHSPRLHPIPQTSAPDLGWVESGRTEGVGPVCSSRRSRAAHGLLRVVVF